jgi:hypothetical protein
MQEPETEAVALPSQQDPHPKSILDPQFKYYPAAATDVQRTWRKYGWVSPSEQFHESSS